MTTAKVLLETGSTAEALPALGQGTWYMGEGRSPRRKEIAALQRGLERGLRLIDSAEMYGDGAAERLVGEAIQGRRDQAFVVSKVYPWNAGRDSAIAACEASLERLGTDYLDLYLLHWPGSIPLDETLEAFDRLVAAGKIRRFGVSNFDVDAMQTLASLPGGGDCAVNQVLYHLASRGIEVALRPWQRRQRMPLMAYCPLAQAGAAGADPLADPQLGELAADLGLTPAQLLLAWTIRPVEGQHEVIAIPKAASPEHVDDNARALEVTLDEATLARLDALYPAPQRKVPLDIV
ncbi:aldo/keto reductase [Halomonas litopenaei]|uniref:aldo/keto reductase n=1 Tax=Halomonas litopenaei TaxID=2109328 RepID=UPI003FA16A5F